MRRSSALQQRARVDVDHLLELFRGHMASIKELQLNADRQEDFLEELWATEESYLKHSVKVAAVYTGMLSWFQLQFLLPIGVLVFLMTRLLHLPLPAVAAYSLVLLYMNGPIAAVGRNLVAGLWAWSGRTGPHPVPGARARRRTRWSRELVDLGLDPTRERDQSRRGTHTYASRKGETPFVLGPPERPPAPQ
jgi:hypothetical protein